MPRRSRRGVAARRPGHRGPRTASCSPSRTWRGSWASATLLVDLGSAARRPWPTAWPRPRQRWACDLLVLRRRRRRRARRRSEPGLASPLCDAVMLAAARASAAARRDAVVGAVFGPCCDGELTLDELLDRLARCWPRPGGLLGPRASARGRRGDSSARARRSRPRPARRRCAARVARSAPRTIRGRPPHVPALAARRAHRSTSTPRRAVATVAPLAQRRRSTRRAWTTPTSACTARRAHRARLRARSLARGMTQRHGLAETTSPSFTARHDGASQADAPSRCSTRSRRTAHGSGELFPRRARERHASSSTTRRCSSRSRARSPDRAPARVAARRGATWPAGSRRASPRARARSALRARPAGADSLETLLLQRRSRAYTALAVGTNNPLLPPPCRPRTSRACCARLARGGRRPVPLRPGRRCCARRSRRAARGPGRASRPRARDAPPAGGSALRPAGARARRECLRAARASARRADPRARAARRRSMRSPAEIVSRVAQRTWSASPRRRPGVTLPAR